MYFLVAHSTHKQAACDSILHPLGYHHPICYFVTTGGRDFKNCHLTLTGLENPYVTELEMEMPFVAMAMEQIVLLVLRISLYSSAMWDLLRLGLD